MAQKPKIDMSHGFMRDITRNQIDRNKYNDERAKVLSDIKKHYDPPQAVRKVPSPNEAYDWEEPEIDMEITVEISPGNVFTISVSKNRDTLDLANEIAEKSGMEEDLIPALDYILKQKMK